MMLDVNDPCTTDKNDLIWIIFERRKNSIFFELFKQKRSQRKIKIFGLVDSLANAEKFDVDSYPDGLWSRSRRNEKVNK